jgi:hypothetical protein
MQNVHIEALLNVLWFLRYVSFMNMFRFNALHIITQEPQYIKQCVKVHVLDSVGVTCH